MTLVNQLDIPTPSRRFLWPALLLCAAVATTGCNTQVDYGEPEANETTAAGDEAPSSENPAAESIPSPTADPPTEAEELPLAGSPEDHSAAGPDDFDPNANVTPPFQPDLGSRYAETKPSNEPSSQLAYDDVFGPSEDPETDTKPKSPAGDSPEEQAPAPWETTDRRSQPSDEEFVELFSGLSDAPPAKDNPPEVEPARDPSEASISEEPPTQPPPSEELSTPATSSEPEPIEQFDPFNELTPLDQEPAEEAPDELPEATREPEPAPLQDFEPEWAPAPAETTPPMAEPPVALAPTPIDVDNTRHLVWVLGSKLSLAALEPLMSASQNAQLTPAGEDDWQVDAIAQMLNVTPPPSPAATAANSTPARAIGSLLGDARRLGDELSRRHGADHAALLEVAVKTNALLLLYEANPTLAKPIRQAVSAAAERAKLPRTVWEPLIQLLDGQPSNAALRQAIFKMQTEAEQSLRHSGKQSN